LYRDQGRFVESSEHFLAAKNIVLRSGDQSQLPTALLDLGDVELQLGRLHRALEVFELAAEAADKGSDLERRALRALGNAHSEQGHLKTALQFFKRAELMDGDRFDAALQADIGDAYLQQADFEQAMDVLQRAMRETPRSALWSAEAELAKLRSVLGAVHHWRGDVDRAMRLYRQALSVQARVLRVNHPDLVSTRISHARAVRDNGDLAAAIGEISSLEVDVRGGANQGPDLSRVLILKADLLREGQQYVEAERILSEALDLQAACFEGSDSPEIAVALNTFGSILHDQKKWKLAHETYARALAIGEQSMGSEHPEIAAAHNNLGTLFSDLGYDDQAERHYRKCLEIQLRIMPADSAELSTSFNNLAVVLFRRGSLGEAAAMLQKALQVMDRAKVPSNNPERLVYAEHLEQVKGLLDSVEETMPVLSVLES